MPHPAPTTSRGPTTRQPLASPIIAFVEATDKIITDHNEDFIFGDIELGHEQLPATDVVNVELVEEVVGEIATIRGNSGVGSPEVAKYVDAWQPFQTDKADVLRSLAEQLYQRRPVLYLQGHPEPVPASVLLRTVQKPSVSAITGGAAAAAGLFKFPSNSFIVIKFDPKFGYADIIVDPFFTDAFVQQPATATYSKLLASLPRAFVGTATELRKVVALLTQQSILTYATKGATCPPWRRFDAMLARWLPKKFIDEPITHGPGAAAAAAAAAPAAAAVDSPVNFPMAPLRTDSAASSDLSFSLSSTKGSSSSNGSLSVPRTVVHGFDIPSKPVASTVPAAAAAAAAAADYVESLAVPATVPNPAAAAAADATEVVSKQQQQQQVAGVVMQPAGRKEGVRDDSGLLLLPSFLPVSTASPNSWQLAAVHAEPAAAAAAEAESDDGDGDVAAPSACSISDAISTVKEHQALPANVAAAAPAPAAPAKPDEQKLQLSGHFSACRTSTAADMSAQLLAANGYSSIRVVKMMGPSAAAAAAAAASGTERGVAALIPGKPRAVSFSGCSKPGHKQQGTTAAGSIQADENHHLSIDRTVKFTTAGASKGVMCLPDLAADLSAEFMVKRAPLRHLKPASLGTSLLGNLSGLNFTEPEELGGLTAMVARIREAAKQAAAAAAPDAGAAGKIVCGRRVVRLDCNGTAVVPLECLHSEGGLVHGARAA